MPVHIFGMPCNIIGIQKIAKKFNLKVVEDATEALGVNLKENKWEHLVILVY